MVGKDFVFPHAEFFLVNFNNSKNFIFQQNFRDWLMEESEKPILVPDQDEMVKEIFEIKPSTNDRIVYVILSQRIEDLKKLILSVKIKLFVG